MRKELQDTSYLRHTLRILNVSRRLDSIGSARSSKGTIRASQKHFPKALMASRFILGLW